MKQSIFRLTSAAVIIASLVMFLSHTEFIFAQSVYNNIQERIDTAIERSESIATDSSTSVSKHDLQRTFFDIHNMALWMLWIVLIMVIVFLISVRHGALQYSFVGMRTSPHQGTTPVSKKTSGVSLIKLSHNQKKLHHRNEKDPIRVLKVRVRKIKKK